MRYKNKNIRWYYSVMYTIFVIGSVVIGLGLLLMIIGLISTSKRLNNVQHIDTVLQDSGNHAGNAAYFDITESPVFLSSYKKDDYYLITDGNEYRIAELGGKEYEKIKSAVDETGSYHVCGMTHFIVDSDTRKDIASKVSSLTGQNMTSKTMDDVLGDVVIECMKINFWNLYKNSAGMVGIIIVPIFLILLFLPSFYELRTSRKVTSLGNITAKEIDAEACKDGSVWLSDLRIYVTENMVLGIISDAKKHYGQVALKYNEIQRIYGYNKADENKPIERSYIVEAVAVDGNKYILSDSKMTWSSDDWTNEMDKLFELIKDKNPNVQCEPDDVKYLTYRFAYTVLDEDGNESSEMAIDAEDIISDFNGSNLGSYFKPADAIVSMKMSIPADGVVEITTGFFGDREEEVKPVLYDFLKGQLMDGWGENVNMDYGCVIDFKELDVH
ncbi:hypothetical protein [Eubacterium ruminantium]|uniref:hypothetical protein n=1 Tax=Eubacterium ruminantium TaxID=42322 RepID=UPI0015688DA7|nr:hypothetical protein [Eubacterium ruminantium]